MTDLLTQRVATAKGGRARTRLSATERDAVQTQRAASRAALAGAIASRDTMHYERTVTRMQSLQTELTYARESLQRHREAGCWVAVGCTHDSHAAYETLRTELAAVFATPMRQSDTAPGGRYERFIAYHMRRIASRITIGSMLITGDDSRDILSLAIIRAYTESALVEDSRGQMVPTLGTLYRLSRAELMRTVSRARHEVQTVSRDADWYSERDEMPRNGAMSLMGVDPARLDWESDSYTVRAILTPAPRWSVAPDAADIALAERIAERAAKRARREAREYAAERAESRAESAERAAYGDDDALGIDAACVSLISTGSESIDSLAERLSVKRETILRRLSSVRITPSGRGYAVKRLGSDGRSTGRKGAGSGKDTRPMESRQFHVTRSRPARTQRSIAWDSVRESMRIAPTVAPMPHYADELAAAVESGNERVIALVSAVADATASLRATDSRSTVMQSAPVALSADARHVLAHRQSRCNCRATGV